MVSRIARLKTELEQLEEAAASVHPDLQGELLTLIEDMRAHVAELEGTMVDVDEDDGTEPTV